MVILVNYVFFVQNFMLIPKNRVSIVLGHFSTPGGHDPQISFYIFF